MPGIFGGAVFEINGNEASKGHGEEDIGPMCLIISNPYLHNHIGVMDYDEASSMHLTPGVVHNFPKAEGV